MELDLTSAAFWIAVGQIILIDIVLSGDNAVVIALACRNLSPEQRKKGILWGVAGAVSLRVVLTVFAALVMNLPWLKFVGGLLLVWIAVKLMLPEDEEGHDIQSSEHLWGAVKTIVVADFVMSLDNVIAVAGAAHGSLALLLFGLAVSIPLIVWSSQLILHWMERFPSIVLFGAGLLGYVAGVQRKEIRQGIACVKHQNMAGSDIGDNHKEYFAGEAALKASGKDNTMNQFH